MARTPRRTIAKKLPKSQTASIRPGLSSPSVLVRLQPFVLVPRQPFVLAGRHPFALVGRQPFVLVCRNPSVLVSQHPLVLAGRQPFVLVCRRMNGCAAHTPESPYVPLFCLMAHMPTSHARARRLYFPGLSNCLPGVLSPNPSNFQAQAEWQLRLGYHVSMENQERISEAAVNGERVNGPSPDPFTETVAQTVAAHDLLPAGSAIVVAVSGGADSIALLTALQQLAPRQPLATPRRPCKSPTTRRGI